MALLYRGIFRLSNRRLDRIPAQHKYIIRRLKMKKQILLIALILCALCVLPLAAQTSRNAVNAALDSWTVDGAENGMKDKVSNVVIQRTNNQMQYYLQVRDGDAITYDFDRVTKRLRINVKKQLQLSTELTFTESGSTSSITYTDKDGKVNSLHFSRK